jgi:hypothetical protein
VNFVLELNLISSIKIVIADNELWALSLFFIFFLLYMEWGFTITNLLCCSHFIFFLWVLTTCKFLIYCFRSFLFIVSWSSIKQTLIAAVTAKLFVKLIADPTLCQTGGVSVH